MSGARGQGAVTGVNGNIVAVRRQGPVRQGEVAMVHCGPERLASEVIRVEGEVAWLQVFEDTRGVAVGMPVSFRDELLSVTLAPGMLGTIYDGLQRPLHRLDDRQGLFLRRGAWAEPVDEQRRWAFRPAVEPGARVEAGDWLGWVPEHHVRHHVMAPLELPELADGRDAGKGS